MTALPHPDLGGGDRATGSSNAKEHLLRTIISPDRRLADIDKRVVEKALLKINTPVDEQTIRSLHVGDTVSVSGRLYTGRDAVHQRLHEGVEPPVDLEGHIIYHCAPVMKKEGGRWVCTAAGPATSSREEPYQWEVIRDYKIRGVIGKGGMGEKTLAACKEYGAVYLHAIGGAPRVCAASIKHVDGVDWMDLGSPEAIWHLWVEDFMAIVTMDAHGQSLHRQVFEDSKQRLEAMQA